MYITVYCGSRLGNNEIYKNAANEFGKFIGENHHTLVYGGSKDGIMGELAKSTLENGGKVIGVRPHKFKEEDAFKKCTEMIVTNNLSDRKRKMIELGDFFVAFPGGTGTLDEISEVMVERSIGGIDNTYVLLNLDGFYSTFYKFLKELHSKGFITDIQLNQVLLVNDVEELKLVINNHNK